MLTDVASKGLGQAGTVDKVAAAACHLLWPYCSACSRLDIPTALLTRCAALVRLASNHQHTESRLLVLCLPAGIMLDSYAATNANWHLFTDCQDVNQAIILAEDPDDEDLADEGRAMAVSGQYLRSEFQMCTAP